MVIDIKEMTAVLNEHPDDMLLLVKSEFNDRTRFTKSKKAIGDQFDISSLGSRDEMEKYESRVSRYGFYWSESVKNDRFAVPSLKEVLDGLTLYLEKKLSMTLKDIKQPDDIKLLSEQYKQVFAKLAQLAGVKDPNVSLKDNLDNL